MTASSWGSRTGTGTRQNRKTNAGPSAPLKSASLRMTAYFVAPAQDDRLFFWRPFRMTAYFVGTRNSFKQQLWVSVRASVALLILAVRSILSQLKGLPSMARLRVLNRTMEKTWR